VFVRVQYFTQNACSFVFAGLKNTCSRSFMFVRTRTNTCVRSIRVRVRSSLFKNVLTNPNSSSFLNNIDRKHNLCTIIKGRVTTKSGVVIQGYNSSVFDYHEIP